MATDPALTTSHPPMAEAFALITYDAPVSEVPVVVESNCALSEVDSFLGHHITFTENFPGLPVRIAPAGTGFIVLGTGFPEGVTLYANDGDQIVGAICL